MLNHTIVSIVDDNQPFRDSLRKLVMLFGYTVESFPSAADSWHHVSCLKPTAW
jgi:FixJ family two-component response regulator